MNQLSLLEVYDSRGDKTIKACLKTKEFSVHSYAPEGKSTGKHEVLTFPIDEKTKQPSVKKGIEFFNAHKKDILAGFANKKQYNFDAMLKQMDGTDNFSNMGGSIAIALSMLFLKYSAMREELEVYRFLNPKPNPDKMPKPLGNVIGGGLHSHDSLPIQEMLVTHLDCSVVESIDNNIKIYREIEKQLLAKKIFYGKNDEGAITANLSVREALQLIEKAKYNLGLNTKIGLDIAASSFYKEGYYHFGDLTMNESEFNKYINDVLDEFDNIIYVEDPFYEESFEAFADLQKQTKAYVCGDDLYTTNIDRIALGIAKKSTKAVLIKPNQIGTISDTYAAVQMAKDNDMIPVISHRSGETCDALIAHLAVGWELPFIKTGTLSGERLAKLNELIYIYNELKKE